MSSFNWTPANQRVFPRFKVLHGIHATLALQKNLARKLSWNAEEHHSKPLTIRLEQSLDSITIPPEVDICLEMSRRYPGFSILSNMAAEPTT